MRPFYVLVLLGAFTLGACSGGEPDAKESKDLGVEASITAVDFQGIIELSLGPLSESELGWLSQELSLKNSSDRPVTLSYGPEVDYLGDGQMAVTFGGCGPANERQIGCPAISNNPIIQPGETLDISVGIYKDMANMKPLVAGRYEWEKKLSYAVQGEPVREGSFTVAYQVK